MKRISNIWENSHQDLCAKALDHSNRSISQTAKAFELFNRFLYFFCIKIEYHNTFKMVQLFFSKKIKLGLKGSKNGQNGLFGTFRKIESY